MPATLTTPRPGVMNGYEVLAEHPSQSDPGTYHQVRRSAMTGEVYCTCRGWGTHRHCWHMDGWSAGQVERARAGELPRPTATRPMACSVSLMDGMVRRTRRIATDLGHAMNAFARDYNHTSAVGVCDNCRASVQVWQPPNLRVERREGVPVQARCSGPNWTPR